MHLLNYCFALAGRWEQGNKATRHKQLHNVKVIMLLFDLQCTFNFQQDQKLLVKKMLRLLLPQGILSTKSRRARLRFRRSTSRANLTLDSLVGSDKAWPPLSAEEPPVFWKLLCQLQLQVKWDKSEGDSSNQVVLLALGRNSEAPGGME